MNPNYAMQNEKLSQELKKYLLKKQGKGPLFVFLLFSAIVALVFLVTTLKPHRLYKKLLAFIFGLSITINGTKYKLQHFLLLLAGFFATIFFFLLMQLKQYYPSNLDPYEVKMQKLDKKWVQESQSWLAFLCVICLISIYNNSKLFSHETHLIEKLKEKENEEKNTKKSS